MSDSDVTPMTYDRAVSLSIDKIREVVTAGPANASASTTELFMVAFATGDFKAWVPDVIATSDELWARLNGTQRDAVKLYLNEKR